MGYESLPNTVALFFLQVFASLWHSKWDCQADVKIWCLKPINYFILYKSFLAYCYLQCTVFQLLLGASGEKLSKWCFQPFISELSIVRALNQWMPVQTENCLQCQKWSPLQGTNEGKTCKVCYSADSLYCISLKESTATTQDWFVKTLEGEDNT